MPTAGQNSLSNFYLSVKFSNPTVAALMAPDIETVAIYSLGADKSGGEAAARRLEEKARDLPEIQRRVLHSALSDLGY
jgi:hypothetical protein